MPGLHPTLVQDYVSESLIKAVVAQRSIKTAEEIEQLEAVRPGVEFRHVHQLVCAVLTCGIRELGLMRGDVDEAAQAGAHTHDRCRSRSDVLVSLRAFVTSHSFYTSPSSRGRIPLP